MRASEVARECPQIISDTDCSTLRVRPEPADMASGFQLSKTLLENAMSLGGVWYVVDELFPIKHIL